MNSTILNSRGHRVEGIFIDSIILAGGRLPGTILQWVEESGKLKLTDENVTGILDTSQKMVLIESPSIGNSGPETKVLDYATAVCMMRGDTAWCITVGLPLDSSVIGASIRAVGGVLVPATIELFYLNVAHIIGIGKTDGSSNWHPVQFY